MEVGHWSNREAQGTGDKYFPGIAFSHSVSFLSKQGPGGINWSVMGHEHGEGAAGQEMNPAQPEEADRARWGLPGCHCGD